ncbi:MAG: DoxX family protein [Saprospiraceae bacterium]|nr:DoxX family protein [Saprospiraceae bacterium]MBK9630775.1 DoxX family protein [Saprospiraceae bacterium]
MNLVTRLDEIHSKVKSNKWFYFFAVFNRIALAAGFIPSGLTKIFGERFTSLSINHPMGNYLESLYHTGYYYPFIGYVQVIAAILLLIPRTATLGAIVYFPVILNICILSLAVGFEGSLVTSPLMVMANLYLICWDYDKLKFIISIRSDKTILINKTSKEKNNKFPVAFSISVILIVVLTVLIVTNSYTKQTRNTLKDCIYDCKNSANSQACLNFCDCIHIQGKSFSQCSEQLRKAKKGR